MGEELDAADAHCYRVVHKQAIFTGHDQVARPHQHQAAGNALALHLGNGRFGDVAPALGKTDIDFLFPGHLRFNRRSGATEPAEGADRFPLGHSVGGIDFGHVMAGGEVLTVGCQNDHLDLVVAVGAIHGGIEFVQQMSVLGVTLVGAIEADASDVRRRFFVGNGLEFGNVGLGHDHSLESVGRLSDCCSWLGEAPNQLRQVREKLLRSWNPSR
ncbi:hypothetical protein D3C81_1397380 [compost metagenome]